MVPPAFTVTPAMIGDVAVSVWAVTGFPVSLTITVFLIQRSLRERLAFQPPKGISLLCLLPCTIRQLSGGTTNAYSSPSTPSYFRRSIAPRETGVKCLPTKECVSRWGRDPQGCHAERSSDTTRSTTRHQRSISPVKATRRTASCQLAPRLHAPWRRARCEELSGNSRRGDASLATRRNVV